MAFSRRAKATADYIRSSEVYTALMTEPANYDVETEKAEEDISTKVNGTWDTKTEKGPQKQTGLPQKCRKPMMARRYGRQTTKTRRESR